MHRSPTHWILVFMRCRKMRHKSSQLGNRHLVFRFRGYRWMMLAFRPIYRLGGSKALIQLLDFRLCCETRYITVSYLAAWPPQTCLSCVGRLVEGVTVSIRSLAVASVYLFVLGCELHYPPL